MSKLFFTSDLHLGHANILKYCGRTIFMTDEDKEIFNNLAIDKANRWKVSEESLRRHDEGIIKRWNERVGKNDKVFHIGDFCFKNSLNRGEGINVTAKSWEERLNGEIIFIKGNHDRNNSCKTRIQNLVINIDNHYINLVHDPARADMKYEINLVGHVHNSWEIKRVVRGMSFTDVINVGVDVWNYMPITYDEIKSRYNRWLKQNEK